MSILRDVQELGLGHDHFLITGNDFPSDWADPTPEEEYISERNKLNSLNTLDTKKGWFQRRRFIDPSEKPVGFVGNEEFYHIDQARELTSYTKMILDGVEESLSDFVKKVELDGLSTESKLNKHFEYLKQNVLLHLNVTYSILKEGSYFDGEPFDECSAPDEDNIPF